MGETTWNIKDNNNDIKFEGGPYSQSFYKYFSKKCLPSGSYDFNIFDKVGNGLTGGEDGDYKVSVGNRIVVQGFGNFGHSKAVPFFICTSDDQCRDSIDCTIDQCNNGICTNICSPFGSAE